MGSKFRTMLAPINRATGDGRRFATGGMSLADTPFPLEWVRERTEGHHGAVSIGVVQEAAIMSVGQAIVDGYLDQDTANRLGLDASSHGIFGRGEMFDDADRETMPELAEDVATAIHHATNGVLGPSVDLDSFEFVPVKVGTDDPVTWADMIEADERGEELKLEMLITQGRVRAGTLVSIPAYVETSAPFIVETPEAEADASDVEALVASIAPPAAWTPPATAFEPPETEGLVPITWDYERGQVYGHVAPKGVCHVGFRDECVLVPEDPSGGAYAWFHRFPVETEDGGIAWAGRLTVGGRHPVLNLTASQAMAQYDTKTVAAYVQARDTPDGVFVCGPINPELSEGDQAILGRRKVSGDWREFAAGLGMIEVLALSPGPRQHSEPGFPVNAHMVNGRQTALTASFGAMTADRVPAQDFAAVARSVLRAEAERERERAALAAALDADASARREEARAALAAAMETEPRVGAAARECAEETEGSNDGE